MEGVICIKCFWSHGKILFLAEIIAGQRSALMCNCIAGKQEIFYFAQSQKIIQIIIKSSIT